MYLKKNPLEEMQHHEGRGGHAAVLCQKSAVEAGEAEVQQVGLILVGGGERLHSALLVGRQHPPGEV